MTMNQVLAHNQAVNSGVAAVVKMAEAWRDAQISDWDDADRLAAVHNRLIEAVDGLRAARSLLTG